MITVLGQEWGTADEIAAELGPDITPDTVRRWADRNGLQAARSPGRGRGTTRYPLDQAAAIEASTRTSRRGRPRRLDAAALTA